MTDPAHCEETIEERAARRRAIAPGTAVNVSEDLIRQVVHAFYDRIRADAMLGPIFGRVIRAEAWDTHLAKMCDFWSSVLLMTGRYSGRPMPAHIRIGELDAPHFSHWLALFGATVDDLCEPDAAALFKDRAQKIADSLLMGVRYARGQEPDWLGPAQSAG